MALRKPLVIIGGQVQQLPAGDTLDAPVSSPDLLSVVNSNASAITIGQLVYSDGNGSVDLAQADAAGTKTVLGMVYSASIANGASGEIAINGLVTAITTVWDALTGDTGGLTAGAEYYLDESTAGSLTTTSPRAVGS
jgi:predicted RecA/RadA family phage recombinase